MSVSARPLRVVVTRPAAQAAAWVEQLRERGVAAEALPLIEIAAVEVAAPLLRTQCADSVADEAAAEALGAEAARALLAAGAAPYLAAAERLAATPDAT